MDNDNGIASLLMENLQSEGYDVTAVSQAEEALTLPLDTFQLVISEVVLPGEIDGLELLERMKEDRMTQHVPLMFCTVRDGERDIIAGLNAGADDYIIKPFSLREFMARIRSVLRRHPAHHRIPHPHPQHRLAHTDNRRRDSGPLTHRIFHTHTAHALAQQALPA